MPSGPAFARLGVHPTATGGELRVWSEHASSMRLVLFDPEDLDRVTGELDMHRMKKDKGTWHIATRELAPSKRDLVVGISASSVTPFVRSALAAARAANSGTVLVTCGPRVRGLADIVIAPAVGAEVLAGSTRMKAGTATKLVLNQMTLLAMNRSNKVYGPFMVDVKPTSAKLRDRAVRMVAALAELDRERAESVFDAAGEHVKTAVVMARLEVSRNEARKRLDAERGSLRSVLEGKSARERARKRHGAKK